MFAIEETVGLAEWIIDDTCLAKSTFIYVCEIAFIIE